MRANGGISATTGVFSSTLAVTGASTFTGQLIANGGVFGALTGNATTATTLQTARTIAISGDGTGTATSFNGSSNITVPFTLATTGVTAGTYCSVTVDAKGRVTAGTNPTTIAGYGITDAVSSSDSRLTNSRPASDVSAWAKAATKPSYAFSEIGSKPTTVAGYGITDSFEVKSSVATDANGLVLKGSYLIADTEKSYILVQSTRTVATETTPVTQIKMPTEGTGNPAWRCGSGNPIVWGAWKPLGGISEEAYIDYNSTTKSLDFNFTGV